MNITSRQRLAAAVLIISGIAAFITPFLLHSPPTQGGPTTGNENDNDNNNGGTNNTDQNTSNNDNDDNDNDEGPPQTHQSHGKACERGLTHGQGRKVGLHRICGT